MDITIKVSGMTCGHCEQSVTSELMEIEHIEKVAVDLSTGNVVISASHPVDMSLITQAVIEAGYAVVAAHE